MVRGVEDLQSENFLLNLVSFSKKTVFSFYSLSLGREVVFSSLVRAQLVPTKLQRQESGLDLVGVSLLKKFLIGE